ncbi:hypothetical protein BCR42DRAFT_213857 [Absidia repens]|uniref:SWIM-type domain-containing protein n=1 Tax=Absidia repens TaxID=90262 RepID=A0A1X2HKG7_9FUNG|nr:hypothetical protein BCR42DRAFT_213857 [Absidia repens]
MLSIPVNMSNQSGFENLLGKISHFALRLTFNEFLMKDLVDQKVDCHCYFQATYGLPCGHTFPPTLNVDEIDMFWHLKDEEKFNNDIAPGLESWMDLLKLTDTIKCTLKTSPCMMTLCVLATKLPIPPKLDPLKDNGKIETPPTDMYNVLYAKQGP